MINVLTEAKAGQTRPITQRRLNSREQKILAATSGPVVTATGIYDFSVSGGAAGDFNLSHTIPAGAIPVEVVVDVITAVTGATTVKVQGDAVDIYTLSALTAGVLYNVPTAVKSSAEAQLQLNFNLAPTAGKVRVFVRYIQSQVS